MLFSVCFLLFDYQCYYCSRFGQKKKSEFFEGQMMQAARAININPHLYLEFLISWDVYYTV